MSLNIRYKSPGMMYTHHSQAGGLIEGRMSRKGGSSMEIGAMCRSHRIYNVHWSTEQVPEIPGKPVRVVNYTEEIETFCPLSLLGEIKRYDTCSWWYLSYQETMRHLGMATVLTSSPYWTTIKEIANTWAPEVLSVLTDYYDFILNQADTSFEQWTYYVKEHKESASPFGAKWRDILDNESRMKIAYDSTLKWLQEFVDFLRNFKIGSPIYIKADFMYPGVRARPGEYYIAEQNEKKAIVHVKKWRDRTVGGIAGLSQANFPVYHNKHAKLADAIIDGFCKKKLGCEIHSLSSEGPQTYLDLLNEKDLDMRDMKVAEKQVALAWDMLPFNGDVGLPEFNPAFAGKMYSGIGATKPLNQIHSCLVQKAYDEIDGFRPNKLWLYSDNVASDKKMPDSIHLESADTFCGFNPKERRFGPVSIVTDNPKHRLNFNGMSQRQIQTTQYYMRPFLSIVMGNISPGQDSCVKFLKYVVDKIDWRATEAERQDHIKEVIMGKSRDEHVKITDQFPGVMAFIDRYWNTQKFDPTNTTDLRVVD